MAVGAVSVISNQISTVVLATGSLQEVGQFILEWAWDIWWALVLGFTISGAIQAYVSQERMVELLGGRGSREIGLGAFFGFLSSSCSFAAIATTRTIFKKGASPEASLAAFQFASTNLVIEIGLVMWILLGWQFVIADFLGGVFLILLFAAITKYLVPDSWFESARDHPDETGGGMQMDTILSLLLRVPKRLLSSTNISEPESSRGEHEHAQDHAHTDHDEMQPEPSWKYAFRRAIHEWKMVWSDIIVGFIIAGFIAAYVPQSAWTQLFSLAPQGTFAWVALGSLIGVIVGIVTFICSVANVPFALVLWSAGIPFGGVLAFIFADLIVPQIVNIYRKYYGLRMAVTLFVSIFFVAFVSGILIHYLFVGLNLVPQATTGGAVPGTYTLVLNVLFTPLFLAQVYVTYIEPRRGSRPMSAES
ncbi:permease [Haladaptatus sp. R4]|uniref:permease n=1 Tax=Haladaptatus sp. R4 TaxID=1679489 RepID=UPI0007B4CA25|nr:permease [Haladaptatus sp. R4]KZN22646.1 permease [Haladaptatus sp. R4]